MRSTRVSAAARHGRARLLARPLLFCVLGLAGCGEGESATWVGVQDCAVGIPPESQPSTGLASVQLPLSEALVTPLGNGFSIRNFTLGPIGVASAGFSCEAPQVTARFASGPADSTARTPFAPAGARGPIRALELLPFECRGADGRLYTLDGEGQADQDALFFNQTFSAWLGTERATLVCSTRFQRQLGAAATAADAGVFAPPAPFGPALEPPAE